MDPSDSSHSHPTGQQPSYAFLSTPNNPLLNLLSRPPLTSHRRPCHRRRHRFTPPIRTSPLSLAAPRSPDKPDPEEDEDPELSRRVFLGGITATSIFTALAGYRFVIGEDLESRLRLRFAQRFPALFPREQTPAERRRPLNAAFAKGYFDATQRAAVQMGLVSAAQLRREEEEVRRRAYRPFFFEGTPIEESYGDALWLNYVLYARLHVISGRSSPQRRREFVEQLALETMGLLKTRGTGQSKEGVRVDAGMWIEGLERLLEELVEMGWISGFRVEEFDGGEGSAWRDEKRATLTVYAYDPVTIQAAQLIGEEHYEEISPKVSGWMREYLRECGINATYEDYYLDDAYRPDPEQFKPSQLATQFDLSL